MSSSLRRVSPQWDTRPRRTKSRVSGDFVPNTEAKSSQREAAARIDQNGTLQGRGHFQTWHASSRNCCSGERVGVRSILCIKANGEAAATGRGEGGKSALSSAKMETALCALRRNGKS